MLRIALLRIALLRVLLAGLPLRVRAVLALLRGVLRLVVAGAACGHGQGGGQQGYPQQQPTATAPTATATAQPVIGIPCQADGGCGLNRCNLTTKTCAPCASAADCQSGGCALGICVPGVAQ